MLINSRYISKEAQPALPTKIHRLQLDPTSKRDNIEAGSQITFDIPCGSAANGSFIDFSNSYFTFDVAVQGTADGKKAKLPHKSSIKSLVTTFQLANAGTDEAPIKSPLNNNDKDADATSRSNPRVDTMTLRINGNYYVANPVAVKDRDGTEAMAELLNCFHKTHGNANFITSATYLAEGSAKPDSKFILGMNVETAVGRSRESFSGVSTLTEAPLLLLTHHGAGSVASIIRHMVQYDCQWRIENGVVKVEM